MYPLTECNDLVHCDYRVNIPSKLSFGPAAFTVFRTSAPPPFIRVDSQQKVTSVNLCSEAKPNPEPAALTVWCLEAFGKSFNRRLMSHPSEGCPHFPIKGSGITANVVSANKRWHVHHWAVLCKPVPCGNSKPYKKNRELSLNRITDGKSHFVALSLYKTLTETPQKRNPISSN